MAPWSASFLFLWQDCLAQDNHTSLQLSLLFKASTSHQWKTCDWMIIFYCITFSWILLTEYSMTMFHSCRQAIISHQDLVCLNRDPFMKIAKFLNPVTLNTILPWRFPVRHHPALFRYLLNTYDHSFLKVFIIFQLIFNTFQSFCFSVMPFSDAPSITPKYFTFFSIWCIIWSYPIFIEFCVHLV